MALELRRYVLWLERGIDRVDVNGPGRAPIKLYLQTSQSSPGTVVCWCPGAVLRSAPVPTARGGRSGTTHPAGVQGKAANRTVNPIHVFPNVHPCVCIRKGH